MTRRQAYTEDMMHLLSSTKVLSAAVALAGNGVV